MGRSKNNTAGMAGMVVFVAGIAAACPVQAGEGLTSSFYDDTKTIIQDLIEASVIQGVDGQLRCESPLLAAYLRGTLNQMALGNWAVIKQTVKEDVATLVADYVFWRIDRQSVGTNETQALYDFVHLGESPGTFSEDTVDERTTIYPVEGSNEGYWTLVADPEAVPAPQGAQTECAIGARKTIPPVRRLADNIVDARCSEPDSLKVDTVLACDVALAVRESLLGNVAATKERLVDVTITLLEDQLGGPLPSPVDASLRRWLHDPSSSPVAPAGDLANLGAPPQTVEAISRLLAYQARHPRTWQARPNGGSGISFRELSGIIRLASGPKCATRKICNNVDSDWARMVAGCLGASNGSRASSLISRMLLTTQMARPPSANAGPPAPLASPPVPEVHAATPGGVTPGAATPAVDATSQEPHSTPDGAAGIPGAPNPAVAPPPLGVTGDTAPGAAPAITAPSPAAGAAPGAPPRAEGVPPVRNANPGPAGTTATGKPAFFNDAKELEQPKRQTDSDFAEPIAQSVNAYNRFLAAFISYLLIVDDEGPSANVARESFRSSAKSMLISFAGDGFTRRGGPGFVDNGYPMLGVRATWSYGYTAGGTEDQYRTQVSLVWPVLRVGTKSGVVRWGAQFSVLDVLSPVSETATRPGGTYQDQSYLLLDALRPRIEFWLGVPAISRNAIVHAGIQTRLVVAERADQPDGRKGFKYCTPLKGECARTLEDIVVYGIGASYLF